GTITWTWTPQYLVHVECANDNPRFSLNGGLTWDDLDTVEDIWVPGDARILISVDYIDTITAVGGGDSVVFCENWTGIGSCLDGLDRTVLDLDFTATSPCSIFFNWSSLLVPLYVYSDHDSPVPSDTSYWVPGTVVDAFVTTPAYDGVDGERWLCTGWVGTGDVPRTGDHPILSFTIEDTSSITWQWQHEYRLTIDSWPTTYDSPFPADGEHWYPAGDSIYGNVTSPVWSGRDTMYCIGFDGTGSAPPISPQIEFGFYIDEPSEVTWKWLPRDSVALLIVLSDYDSPRPYSTTAWRICDPVYAYVDSFVYVGTDRIDCIGWRGGGSVAPTGDLNYMNFNICEDSYIQWQWSTVYFFEVQNPGGYGDPEPDVGVYTYSAGAYVNGEMRDNPYWTGSDTMFCVGYHGWGDLPPTDPHTDFDFHITTNSGLEWQWSNVAYRLTVNSAYGSPWPHGTTYWIPRALVHGATVDSAVLVSPDIRARCIGWTGTGSVPAAGDSNVIPDFFMMEDGSITWQWALQYAFYVTNEGPGADGYDSPVPSPGTYWFDEGDTVTAYITENPVWSVPRADSMYCIGMTGTGSAPIWSPQDSIQFVINVPSSCNWHWLWSDTVAMLVVNSAHDSPMPWGTTYWPLYSDVMAMVDPTDDVDSLSRFFCTGFEIRGSVDSTDTFTFIDFIIDTATDLTWNWTGQYYLTLLWEGITTPPTFVGEGWYNEGDTALFECETPVFDAGGYYGFAYWDFDPDTVIHGDSLIFHSWVEMREPTIARAHYAPGVHVQVLKLPDDDDCGWIAIDSIFYDSTAIYTSWWGRGSYHDLLVPDVDSTASGQRFMFERWSDGLPIGHRVGPITDADTLWTAFYTSQYLAVIAKNPPHTWGFIYADGDTFHDEAAHVFWWSPGPPHEIGVSTPDSSEFPVSDTIRYFFKDWTATGDTSSFDTIPMITTDSIGGPVSYRANYDPKILLHLEKMPPHPYGYLTIDNDTIRDASVFDYWCDPGETPYIGASEFDIVDYHVGGTDSVWEYRNWSDGGLIVHEVGPIDAPASYTAYYDVDTVIMAFSVTPNFWDVGDIHVVETATMVDSEVIVFTNEGNVPLDIGFIISDPGPWMAGVTRGHDKFSLYVHLNDEPTVPTAFNPILDWVKSDLLVWAVNGSSGRFGVGGENILPPTHYSGADVSENIWMQFGSPMSSSAGYGAETLVLAVYAKYHMP
ncbi:hypothetical protein J7L01_04030, partial [bacterium]|nr:hypothetical protein [bacterium]